MSTLFTRTGAYRVIVVITRKLISLKAVALIVAIGTLACANPISIFWDDFEDDATKGNPNAPPIGEPWQISEVTNDGINVGVDMSDPSNNVLWFGRNRNTAVAPFSAIDIQRLQTAQNATVSFDYYGLSYGAYGHFFDIGGFDGINDNPAFLIRIDPQEDLGFHDLYYLDPDNGLVDSGLDVGANAVQTITISIDFATENYLVDVEGSSTAPLPLLLCPSDIHGVQFSNYGVAMASGSIDNVWATVTEPDGAEALALASPEPGTVVLLAMAALYAAFLWFLGPKKAGK